MRLNAVAQEVHRPGVIDHALDDQQRDYCR